MNWNILLIGGASGTGKTSIVSKLSEIFGVKVIEVDDLFQTVKAVTSSEKYPYIHYWDSGVNWINIGIDGNVRWLSNVSNELTNVLKAIIQNHIEDNVPVIIEGDFISPEFAASFKENGVKAIFFYESEEKQIVQNYLNREGGEPQEFRASISVKYGEELRKSCNKYNIEMLIARPWDTLISRALRYLL